MDAFLPILLLVVGVLSGIFMQDRRAKKNNAKEKVKSADKSDKEGAINASLEFTERVKAAQAAVDAAFAARPVSGDAAADLADRIERARRARRQRSSADKPAG